ncbi:hypothetical protein, partial [Candidatus Ichthyocystis sparus]
MSIHLFGNSSTASNNEEIISNTDDVIIDQNSFENTLTVYNHDDYALKNNLCHTDIPGIDLGRSASPKPVNTTNDDENDNLLSDLLSYSLYAINSDENDKSLEYLLDDIIDSNESNSQTQEFVEQCNAQTVDAGTITRVNNEVMELEKKHQICLGTKRKFDDNEYLQNIEQNSEISGLCETTFKEELSTAMSKKYKYQKETTFASKLYTFADIRSSKFTVGIYENAVKKINIDDGNLLRNAILIEFKKKIITKGFDESSMNIYPTYLNILKYVLNKVYQYISNIAPVTDISITPGMSILDIKNKYIANKIFFDRLDEYCKETAKEIELVPHEDFLYTIQTSIKFGSGKSLVTSVRKIATPRRNRLTTLSKNLVIDNIFNLSSKIKSVIANLEIADVSKSSFAYIHGAYVSKSLIRSVLNVYYCNMSVTENGYLKINRYILKEILKKEFEKSVIFIGGKTISPNKSTLELMARYLLTDITTLYFRNGYKLIIEDSDPDPDPDSEKDTPKYFYNREKLNVWQSITKSNSYNNQCTASNAYEKQQSPNNEKNTLQNYSKYTMPEELELSSKVYEFTDIDSISTKSIYENAVDKIDIDEKFLLREIIMAEFKEKIKLSGYDGFSIDISQTYSNIHKYISDRFHGYINRVTISTDISITPGMSISDIKREYISNKIFFNRLNEYCREIATNVERIQAEKFLGKIQNNFYFGSSKCIDSSANFGIGKSPYRRKRLLSVEVRSLIVHTIRNLPFKIISAIEKFEEAEVLESVFALLHGVYVNKSFIRNILNICETKKSHKKDRIAEELRKSVVLIENMTFSPSKSLVESMTNYLLMDMENYYANEEQPSTSFNMINQDDTTKCTSTFGISSEKYHNMISRIKSHLPVFEYICSTELKTPEDHPSDTGEEQEYVAQNYVNNIMPDNLLIAKKSYNYINIYSTGLTTSIYKNIIKKINFDSDRLISDAIIEEFKDKIVDYNTYKANEKIADTYSNITRYILDKISPYIDDIVSTTDVVITPGMSIPCVKHKYVHNKDFFYKLRESCKKIVIEIDKIPHEKFSHIIQSYINLSSNTDLCANIKRIGIFRRNKITALIKLSILYFLYNLPNSIASEIEKIDINNISEYLFVKIHGIYIPKSLIRNITKIYTINKIDMLLE